MSPAFNIVNLPAIVPIKGYHKKYEIDFRDNEVKIFDTVACEYLVPYRPPRRRGIKGLGPVQGLKVRLRNDVRKPKTEKLPPARYVLIKKIVADAVMPPSPKGFKRILQLDDNIDNHDPENLRYVANEVHGHMCKRPTAKGFEFDMEDRVSIPTNPCIQRGGFKYMAPVQVDGYTSTRLYCGTMSRMIYPEGYLEPYSIWEWTTTEPLVERSDLKTVRTKAWYKKQEKAMNARRVTPP